MNASLDFPTFLVQFFELFSNKSFRGNDYLDYLSRTDSQRSGDEASVVDTAIVSPLLGLLGFAPAERVYNLARLNGRPDFAPEDAVLGTCFMVEDKSTSLQLTLDLSNPESHLSQLVGYMRSKGVRLGWLTNGKQFMVWRFNDGNIPTCVLDFDIPTVIRDWRHTTPPTLSEQNETALHTLFDLCHKASFTDGERLEREVATTLEVWQQLALPLGTGSGNETTLVESLQGLVQDLQRDARRVLDTHLQRYTEYTEKIYRLTDTAPEPATQQLSTLREKILSIIADTFQVVWNLEAEDIAAIEDVLLTLAQDARAFLNPKEVAQRILTLVNEARQRKQNTKGKTVRPFTSLDEFTAFSAPLQNYIDKAFTWHQRQALLRHDYRGDLSFYDDYTAWRSLVQETMLGTLDEEKRRDEFALQAAYVVFIRLLLIRVCEDKGVFQHRFLSDGGLKHWQEDIERYFVFTNGNPYAHLLDIAYENAQNIYAHFFTGRELFNWYTLDRRRFILTLYQLSRFNFAEVDSDLIGTIYNTYVNRAEKRNKGQYYTPQEIVDYILDNVDYSGSNVIGSNKRLIDPACGSGAFLVTAAKRLIASYKGTREQVDDPVAVLQRVQQNLFGFDLNPFACYLAEINLLIQVLDLVKQTVASGRPLKLERFNIYNVDALARPSGVYYFMNLNTLQAEENDQVNKIKSRALDTPYAQGFAFVVANPPYGAALSDTYKKTLRENWSDVFYGQPDTYTFFLKLGLDLLSNNGKLGYITPNTYLMGVNTAILRGKLLTHGIIEQIVDLPQGIWNDANVDCLLLFLTAEKDEEKRKKQQVQVNVLKLNDTLDKLTERMWSENYIQQQSEWILNAKYEITIRRDMLIQQIENACNVLTRDGSITKVQRLKDVTDSTQGIIPYFSKTEGQMNQYIKPLQDVPPFEKDWHPVLDGKSFVGRYELLWGSAKQYIKYGKWLYRSHEGRFFDSPKLLTQDMRNRALKRRLVATFDDQGFYNRHNFNDIIAKDPNYNLKYILALFNSSLLNYWFARQFDNLHINPSYFRQLPIYPANAETQAVFVALVDSLLAWHNELNVLREQGYVIKQKRDGSRKIDVPYDVLLTEMQQANRTFPTLTLYDARAIGLFSISERCDMQASVSSNSYIPERYPTSLVLRHNKLWFEVSDDRLRRYLLGYLSRPQWQGKTWDEFKNVALIPEDTDALDAFFALEQQKQQRIATLLDNIQRTDTEIDERVLDLYGITNATDRQRVLGSAPIEEDEAVVVDGEDEV